MIYTVKPQTPIINWGNSLTRGLVFDAPLFENGGAKTTEILHSLSGTFNGTLIWQINVFGTTVKFDGTTGYIDFGNRSVYQPSVFTCIALINPTGSGNRTIFADNGSSGRQFRVNSSGNLELLKENVASIGTSTGTLTNGNWYLVGVIYDASGNYTFYINGVVSGSGTSSQSFSFNNLFIGKQAVNEFFSGRMAQVLLWNRVLLQQEIRKLYINPWQIYVKPNFLNYFNSNPVVAATTQQMLTMMGIGA